MKNRKSLTGMLILCFSILTQVNLNGQITMEERNANNKLQDRLAKENKEAVYFYKTEDDFFKGVKSNRGTFIEDGYVHLKYEYKDNNGKTQTAKFKYKDSSSYYFAYQVGKKQLLINLDPKDYEVQYRFESGNAKGFIGFRSYTDASGGLHNKFCYFDRVNNVTSFDIEDILVHDSELLKKYTAEKDNTDKKIFKRNKDDISNKYFMEFIARQK